MHNCSSQTNDEIHMHLLEIFDERHCRTVHITMGVRETRRALDHPVNYLSLSFQKLKRSASVRFPVHERASKTAFSF